MPEVTTTNGVVEMHGGTPARTCAKVQSMMTSDNRTIVVLSSGEREYIRRELDVFFSTLPSVADGFQLRTWRGGPQKGQPKLPPPARSLVDRGLMRLDTSHSIPRLFFTEAGTTALRQMMADRRLADPVKFAHVRQELGIDGGLEPQAAE